MKHYLIRMMAFAILSLLSLPFLTARAEGLNIHPFFKEEFAKNPAVTMVSVSGRQSGWKGLTSYRSVSISGDDAKADEMARAVRKDGAKAELKETSFKGGHLYFGFYGLGGVGPNRRYLFFLDLRAQGKSKTTLVYIEGDWTPDQVKKLITKKIDRHE